MTTGQGKKLKLLVATNFSEKSQQALEFALVYSANFNADIYLFHVIEGRSRTFLETDRANAERTERMRNQVLEAIDKVAARGIKHTVEGVHRRLSNGKAGSELLTMASSINADMLIMGAPASRGLAKLAAKTPCTLVLVRESDVASPS